MATNIAKTPLLRNLYVRAYSACPTTKGAPVGGYIDYDIKTTTLNNKLVVSSAENESLGSRVAVVFRAGARYETSDNLGITHVLRIAAGLSTKNASQFTIIRNIQEYASTLTCSVDREVISYTLEGLRPSLEKTLPFLAEVTTKQTFKPWELPELDARIRLDLATRPPQLRAVDLLHKAAYRNRGLGNSLYIAKHQIGKISTETLQHYVAKNFTADRAAVVGLGVDHDYLVEFAKCLELGSCTEGDCPSTYKGGEIRSDKGGNLAHVILAGPGGSLRNAKDALSFAILQRAMGAGSSIKYNKENKSPFAKSIPCGNKEPTSVTAFNVSYSDSGLFGALITAPSTEVGLVVDKVAEILKAGKVNEDDFQRGKQQFKTAVMSALESNSTAVEDMSNQAILIGSVANARQIITAADGLKLSDINAAAQRVACGKFTMASVGNLKCVPFLDELK